MSALKDSIALFKRAAYILVFWLLKHCLDSFKTIHRKLKKKSFKTLSTAPFLFYSSTMIKMQEIFLTYSHVYSLNITKRLKMQNGFTYISQWGNRFQFNSRHSYFFFTPCFHQPLQNVNKRFTMTTLSREEGATQRGKKETNANLTVCGLLSTAHVKKQPSLYCSSHSSFLYDTRVSIL